MSWMRLGHYKGARPPGGSPWAEMEGKPLAPSPVVLLTDDKTCSEPDFHAEAFLQEYHVFSWDWNDMYVQWTIRNAVLKATHQFVRDYTFLGLTNLLTLSPLPTAFFLFFFLNLPFLSSFGPLFFLQSKMLSHLHFLGQISSPLTPHKYEHLGDHL